jgi:hypothetical protein
MGCLGRLPPRWALYSTRACAARRFTPEMPFFRHIDRRWRSAEFRHPRGPRHLELHNRPFRDRWTGGRDQSSLRLSPSAFGRSRVAISARPPCGRGDHPGPAHRPGIRGQPEPLALSDSLSVVERPAGRKAASPAGADARCISGRAACEGVIAGASDCGECEQGHDISNGRA